MTRTRTWLDERRSTLLLLLRGGAVLLGLGVCFLGFATGVLLGRLGLYRVEPLLAFGGWLVVAAGLAAVVVRHRARRAMVSDEELAQQIELRAGSRRGRFGGLVEDLPAHASAGLGDLADRQAREWLDANGNGGLADVRRAVNRELGRGAAVAVTGLVLFGLVGPEPGRGFWNPVGLVIEANGPIELVVATPSVRFGDVVDARLVARGRRSVELWQRSPGEQWVVEEVVLDSAGNATVAVGPLESDRYLVAKSGRRNSDTVHVVVALPAMLAELSLVATYPAYLGRPDELLVPGDSVALPVGTRVVTRGRSTVDLGAATWAHGDRYEALAVDGETFTGSLLVTTTAIWSLAAVALDGTPIDSRGATLPVVAVPDSAPVVTIPVPGADTTLAVTLAQPLVIDVHDDYLLTRVELVSRRASAIGTRGEPVVEEIPLPRGGTDRTILQWVLDLNNRGFVPGDTAYYLVRARDNSPAGQVSASREYFLRLPSLAELRAQVTDRTDAVSAAADSLAQAQAELSRIAGELAAERNRSDGDQDQLDFNSAERAQQLEEEQSALLEEARQLQDQISELADLAREAGLTDPEFFEQLSEIREMLQRALSSDLQDRLAELRDALQRLDSRSMRDALNELSTSQEEMREQLERTRDLFERAALEGEMSALAEDAEDLGERQDDWNEALTDGDSTLAGVERELAALTDSLAARLAALGQQMREMGAGDLAEPQEGAESASAEMRQAADMADQGNMTGASQSGEAAGEMLADLPQEIRDQRDQLRDQWRQEVLEAMDRALTEVAELVRNQRELAEQYEAGELNSESRGEQAAIRDGIDRIIEELQEASSMNALVSPRLSTSLGFSRVKMGEVLQQLAQASPNAREAAEAAGAAVDGLNQVAHGLARSRSDVSGSQSGSGVEEALERMMQMAQQQQGINGQADQLLPMMGMGGDELVQQLRELAMQQMQLAQELERLEAEEDISGLGELADEARDVSRRLEAAQLDRATIERQEQLFRRMLDAGRTLRSDRPDERLERRSEAADPNNIRVPEELSPGETGAGPRFRYPDWNALSKLSPEERRLVLEYFRRINENRN